MAGAFSLSEPTIDPRKDLNNCVHWRSLYKVWGGGMNEHPMRAVPAMCVEGTKPKAAAKPAPRAAKPRSKPSKCAAKPAAQVANPPPQIACDGSLTHWECRARSAKFWMSATNSLHYSTPKAPKRCTAPPLCASTALSKHEDPV